MTAIGGIKPTYMCKTAFNFDICSFKVMSNAKKNDMNFLIIQKKVTNTVQNVYHHIIDKITKNNFADLNTNHTPIINGNFTCVKKIIGTTIYE